MTDVAINPMGDMRADDLARHLAEWEGPKIVCLNAADLNVGTFDDFRTLIPMAQAAGAWVHVDGAFGLFARTSDRLKHLTDGIDFAILRRTAPPCHSVRLISPPVRTCVIQRIGTSNSPAGHAPCLFTPHFRNLAVRASPTLLTAHVRIAPQL